MSICFSSLYGPITSSSRNTRVCKVGKIVAVIDIISPDDNDLSNAYNRYETLRDPSHTKALKRSEMLSLFHQAKLSVSELQTIDVEVDFMKWLALIKPSKETADQITRDVSDEIKGGRLLVYDRFTVTISHISIIRI